jgi:Mg-chelatase subunit ChlD
MRLLRLIVLFLSIAPPLTAQWRLDLREVDARALPRVRMLAVLVRDGMPYARAGEAAWRMTQNGLPVDLHADCPDSGWINSLALVLDNSSSMSGVPIQSLKDAAKAMVDSLRPDDEAAVVAFGAGVTLIRDFTNRKDSLRAAIDTMKAGGSTPLIDAVIFALQRISARGGRKALVILTDGIDNSSSGTYAQIRALAAQYGVKLFTIGYGSGGVSENMLETLARETGARYFRIFGPAQLQEVFASIASELTFPGCLLWWDAPSCTDSVRVLHVEATAEGRTVAWDSVMHFPWRPDTLLLRVTAPAEVGPGGYAIAYLALAPRVHTGLLLTFRFLFRFDPNLLEIAPLLPVTLGTIAQNTKVSLSMLRPGVVECSAVAIPPAFATGNLLGFRLTGLAADSSRPVILSIDSVEFAAGCENVILAEPDTIDVCQCKRPLAAWLRAPSLVPAGGEAVFEVCVADTALTARTQFIAQLRYDAAVLTPLRVEAQGGAAAAARLLWDVPAPGVLRIRPEGSFTPSPGTLLLRAVFAAASPLHPAWTAVVLPSIRAWARCCPAALPDTAVAALLDGACRRVVLRQSRLALEAPAPNPCSARARLSFTCAWPEDEAPASARLLLYDLQGALRGEWRCAATPGRHVVDADLRGLDTGAYLLVLEAGEERAVERLRVVR